MPIGSHFAERGTILLPNVLVAISALLILLQFGNFRIELDLILGFIGLNKIFTVSTQIIIIIVDRKSTRLNSSHMSESRMPSSA